MSWSFVQFTMLYLVIGSLIGSLITVLILRRMIKTRIKGYYRLLNDISLSSIKLRREYEKKVEFLKHVSDVTGGLSENDLHSQSDISDYGDSDYRLYISELTELLKNCKIDFPVPKSR